MAKIVLTGVNGGLGSATLKRLLTLVSPSDLVLALHNPDQAPKALKDLGARVCKADYSQPESLDDAFQGADVVFLVSYPSIQHQERFQMHKNAIDAAVRQKVRHVFYSSLAFGGDLESSSRAFVMQAHLSTEAYLASLAASSSLTYTAIREGLYSESYPLYLAFFDLSRPVDEVALPDHGNRGIAWAARNDLGEATANLIHDYARDSTTFPYVNQKILLSGPEAIPLSGVAEILGRLLGHPGPIRIRRASVEEYVARYSATLEELDRDVGKNTKEWATAYEAIKAGESEVVTPTLKEWLGREPEKFEQTLAKLVQQQKEQQISAPQ